MTDMSVIAGGGDRPATRGRETPATRADAESVLRAYEAMLKVMLRPEFRASDEAIEAILGSTDSLFRLTYTLLPPDGGGRRLELADVRRAA